MTLKQASNALKPHRLLLAVATLACGVAAMGGSLVQTPEYRSTTTYIVIQDQRFSDPYAQARSADYVANVLSRVIDTDSFRQAVFAEAPELRGLLPMDQEDLRDEWRSDVTVRVIAETGILQVSTYHVSPAGSTALVSAIGQTLAKQAPTYIGESTSITLFAIDGPITSTFPVRPNVLLNSLSGALVGLVLTSGLLVLRARPRSVEMIAPRMSLRAPTGVASRS